MQIKKISATTISGVLSIGWGVITLYKLLIYLATVPWISLGYNWMKWIGFFYLVFTMALLVGFIVSGIGILKAKPWSRYLLLITTGFALWGLINRMILFGPCTEEYFYLFFFLMGGLFIWFFNQKSIKIKFPYHKDLKIVTIAWTIALSLQILVIGIFWSQYGGYKFSSLQEETYQLRDENFYSENYFRSPFPLKYTLVIPKGFTLNRLYKDNHDGLNISLTSLNKNGVITMSDRSFPQKMQSAFKGFGYNTPYRLSKKIFSEKYGLVFMILRLIAMPMDTYQVEEVHINGLNGFIQKSDGETWINEYCLFQGHEVIGGGIIVGRHEDGLKKSNSDEIISSIKPKVQPLISAPEFFQQGLALLNNQEIEKAKFSFASALCLNWNDPRYHYYLARAFFETGNWYSAKNHLEKAVSLQPDYPEAHELLDEVKDKQRGIEQPPRISTTSSK